MSTLTRKSYNKTAIRDLFTMLAYKAHQPGSNYSSPVPKPEEFTGYELRSVTGKGEGVFATRSFKPKELVVSGIISKSGNENNTHAAQVGVNVFIRQAGLFEKVNHSCDPNCGININSTGAQDIIAFHNIEQGEELTYDYAMGNYIIEHFPPKCECGSRNCRGKIDGWESLPDKRKQAYQGFVAQYLFEMDARKRGDD